MLLIRSYSLKIKHQVNELFQELHRNALILQRREDAEFDAQQPWRKCLPKKYHHFAGNYHRLPDEPYKFELLKSSPDDFDIFGMLHVKMAPPLPRLDAKPTYYNSEDYAKHLIGNVSGSMFHFPFHFILTSKLTHFRTNEIRRILSLWWNSS